MFLFVRCCCIAWKCTSNAKSQKIIFIHFFFDFQTLTLSKYFKALNFHKPKVAFWKFQRFPILCIRFLFDKPRSISTFDNKEINWNQFFYLLGSNWVAWLLWFTGKLRWIWTFCHLLSRLCQTRVSSDWWEWATPCLYKHILDGRKMRRKCRMIV